MKSSELFESTSLTKKIFLIILIIISVILMCSCANKQDIESISASGGKNKEAIDGTIAEIMEEEHYRKVEQDLQNILNDQKQFMDFDSKSTVSISALSEVNKRYIGKPYRYATVDLDGDDIKELLIEFDAGGDTAILRLQNENWIAYYCAYRARTQLKTDGTMSWSNGATHSGTQMLHFNESGIISVPIITYDEDDGYYANGASVTRTECLEAMQKQQQKTDVTWYELN